MSRFRNILEYLCLLGVSSVLMLLGCWQLHRAHEKQNILQQEAREQSYGAQRWQDFSSFPRAFQKLQVRGSLGKTLFFLDNQFHDHRLGYQVLAVLQVAEQNALLVDLGWVPAFTDRYQLPNVVLPRFQDWSGQVYYPSKSKFSLGTWLQLQRHDHYVIESLDVVKISVLLHQNILPWVLRMSLQQDTGLLRRWTTVAVAPQRHYAYALQWFLMAAVVSMMVMRRIFKK